MKAGKSDQEIIAFLTQRYGDFILYPAARHVHDLPALVWTVRLAAWRLVRAFPVHQATTRSDP